MHSDWQKVTLGEYVGIKHGYAFKSAFFTDVANQQILLTPGNFAVGGGFKSEKLKYYDGDIPEDYVLEVGDIVVTMTDLSKQSDTLGFPARVPKDKNTYLHNQRLGKVTYKKAGIEHDFLYYLMCSRAYRHEVLAGATGTSVKHTAPKRIEGFSFYLPPPKEQNAIAAVLKAHDEKINLSTQMCETLEKTASTLFKSWFVDFDPVKAKMEGRAPEGMAADLFALFPDSLEESRMGDIPAGWDVSFVYDWADYINGAAYKNMHFSDAEDALPVIKIAELKNGIGPGTKYTNTDLGNKYLLNTGDILFSWSGSPETSIDTFLWVGGRGWLNQHIFKVIPKKDDTRAFCYFLLKYLKPTFIHIAKNKQTTGLGHVTVKDLKELKVAKPSNGLLKAYEAVARPLYDRLQNNLEEIANLTKTRDTLLPKLISGDLRVEDAEADL